MVAAHHEHATGIGWRSLLASNHVRTTIIRSPSLSSDIEKAIDLARALALEHVAAGCATPVRPSLTPEALLEALDMSIPREGSDLETVAEDLRRVLAATPLTASKRFFNQLFGGRNTAAIMADMLVPVANSSMYTWKIAGPHVLIERELLKHMASKAGYPTGEGLFCAGGSISNFAAMLVARNAALGGARDFGLQGAHLTAYTSEASHYSIPKAAEFAGIGRKNVRIIAVDDAGRMSPAALIDTIARDRAAGAAPFFINATAGTTVEGAFDPIERIADIAQEERLWLHVDGAFGGSVALSSRRDLLAGLERADSFTWDAHKMMSAPLTCSVALFREKGTLEKHVAQNAAYLFQDNNDEFNPGRRSLQCGRRNDGLKLWAAWRQLGDEGYRRRIDHLFDLARYGASIVERTPELTLTMQPESVTVCFEAQGVASDVMCAALLEEGRAVVGWGTVQGQDVVRLVCVNPEMTTDDIDVFFKEVVAVARARSPVFAQGASC